MQFWLFLSAIGLNVAKCSKGFKTRDGITVLKDEEGMVNSIDSNQTALFAQACLSRYLKLLQYASLFQHPGPGSSELTTSLVNVSLKFQMLISQICQYFLLKKFEKLLPCKSFSHFFNKKYMDI